MNEKWEVYAIWYRGFSDNGKVDVDVRTLGIFDDFEEACQYHTDVVNLLKPDCNYLRVWITGSKPTLKQPLDEIERMYSEWTTYRENKERERFIKEKNLENIGERLEKIRNA